ncbi:MAG: hypothetical protein AAF646_17015 [Pseudomonadota bacterium]
MRSLNIAYALSAIPAAFLLVLAAWALFALRCWNGCDAWTDYGFIIFIAPFSVPLIVSLLAIVRWVRGQRPSKSHVVLAGVGGGLVAIAGAFLLYQEDGASLLVLGPILLGWLIGMPAFVALYDTPDLE